MPSPPSPTRPVRLATLRRGALGPAVRPRRALGPAALRRSTPRPDARPRGVLGLAACAVAAAALAGCGAEPLAEEVAAVRDLGPLAFDPVIRGRDGGFSARWGNRTVWVFGDTTLERPGEDGERWRSSTFCVTEDDDASDGLGLCREPLDAAGGPRELLPFTAEEAAFNAAHFGERAQASCTEDCGARYALWPGPVVVDPATGRALLFYTKLMARPGAFNFYPLGSSIALWERPETAPVRPALRPGTTDPTLLFGPDEPPMAAAALLLGETLLAYACEGGLSAPCRLARAPIARATERSAWEFFAGDGRWSADHRDAAAVLDGAPMMTVHRNARLGRWVAYYTAPVASRFVRRTAPAPEGPWSDPATVFEALAPTNPDAWSYAGLGHPELARDGGRLEYVTYFRETGFLAGEVRLVEIELR